MDLSKMKVKDWLIAAGTLLYLISMFLDWHSFSEGDESFGSITLSQNGWSYFFSGILPLILLLAAAVLALLPLLQPSAGLPETFGPLTRAQVILIAAGVAAVLVLLRLIIPAEIEFLGVDTGENYDRAFGLFIAFIGAVVAAVGAFLNYQEGGTSSTPTTPPTPF